MGYQLLYHAREIVTIKSSSRLSCKIKSVRSSKFPAGAPGIFVQYKRLYYFQFSAVFAAYRFLQLCLCYKRATEIRKNWASYTFRFGITYALAVSRFSQFIIFIYLKNSLRKFVNYLKDLCHQDLYV